MGKAVSIALKLVTDMTLATKHSLLVSESSTDSVNNEFVEIDHVQLPYSMLKDAIIRPVSCAICIWVKHSAKEVV